MTTTDWMQFERFGVWGAGKSGKAAANLLAKRGKKVVLSDLRSQEELDKLKVELEEGVEVVGGSNVIGDAEVIVISPGLRPGLEIFEKTREQNVPVISEVELAYTLLPGRWVCITGTDGKTTTTSLVGEMLRAAGIDCVVAGNIGTALSEVVENAEESTVIVAELSANQLWSCFSLQPEAAAITNFAPDHMDYFDSEEQYWAAKRHLLEMQGRSGHVVLPVSDAPLFVALGDDLAKEGRAVTWFTVGEENAEGLHDVVYFDNDGRGRARIDEEEILWCEDFSKTRLIGRHNQLNAACAAALASSLGADFLAIGKGLMEFRPLPHRMEYVETIDEVRFIDDSKATNPHASLAGIKGVDGPVVVIAGGLDKGLPLEEWVEAVAERAEEVVLIGAITDKLSGLLSEKGAKVTTAESLEEAVRQAKKAARPGSTVVLSPACSSYDMFSSYVERGEVFQAAVRALKK